MTKGVRIVDLVVEDDRAALLYDCELPQPVGTLKIAAFFRAGRGKIRICETRFDATEPTSAMNSERGALQRNTSLQRNTALRSESGHLSRLLDGCASTEQPG
jgi:hypothetical protein